MTVFHFESGSPTHGVKRCVQTQYLSSAMQSFPSVRNLKGLAVLVATLLCCNLSLAQTKVPSVAAVVKDPQAVALIQSLLTTKLSAPDAISYLDSITNGTITANINGKPTTMPVVIKTKGTRMTRLELQKPSGTDIRIVNNGIGAVLQPDGSVRRLLMNNTIVERVNHIPSLSLLADVSDPTVSVEAAGTDASGQLNAVSMRPLVTPSISQAAWDSSTTRTSFFVDSETGLISKIAYTDFAENDPNSGVKIEVALSNYKAVSGINIPFQQTLYSGGNPECILTVSDVTFNVGLSDSDFAIPQSQNVSTR
jgi:hypothetical protein